MSVDWSKRGYLEQLSNQAEAAGNIGDCPNTDFSDDEIVEHGHVLCLECGCCFKYCHENDECSI